MAVLFNIACEDQISLNKLLEALKDILKVDIKADYMGARMGDVLHSRADISKAKGILSYSPKIGIKEGLMKTVDWYKNNGK